MEKASVCFVLHNQSRKCTHFYNLAFLFFSNLTLIKFLQPNSKNETLVKALCLQEHLKPKGWEAES